MNRFKSILLLTNFFVLIFMLTTSCKDEKKIETNDKATNILFLHHSTGGVVWKGQETGFKKISRFFTETNALPSWFENYNKENQTNYAVREQNFPKAQPYGWNNYPYDYYQIWVANAGSDPYKEEPTLEMLTPDYDLIVFKHCFPVGNIQPDTGEGDVTSPTKTLENYKLQYVALRDKMHEFPNTRFLVWTAAAHVEGNATIEEARRTREFVNWVKNEWDEPEDNIFLWDFYELETEGGDFLKAEYSAKAGDSHPSAAFGQRVAPLLGNRMVDVLENNGQNTNLKGETK
ncbi:MAG: hypothetical protein KUL83_07960 [Lentimicrobium sp.]|nr:hypothetical protein [Lentimicrobium sp.]MDD2527550.1 hypothetical protein [Lentimicrobiaceae bacterium]MDD4599208.1 hypothetical protein [Lentimicrobiaceae bacterium]MDY0025139.1 hypothetical protein [Lentimicrobium sp.]